MGIAIIGASPVLDPPLVVLSESDFRFTHFPCVFACLNPIRNSVQPTWIGPHRRLIFNIPIQVTIPGIKPQRIILQPPAQRRALVPVAVIVQARGGVVAAALEKVTLSVKGG